VVLIYFGFREATVTCLPQERRFATVTCLTSKPGQVGKKPAGTFPAHLPELI
jgi:hypothetical protein